MKKLILWVGVSGLLTGCASLGTQQRKDYLRWKQEGTLVQEKNEGTAAMLGILPGGGAFYTRRFGVGVVDLLTWPFSILWDPFVGYTQAQKINFEATQYNRQKSK